MKTHELAKKLLELPNSELEVDLIVPERQDHGSLFVSYQVKSWAFKGIDIEGCRATLKFAGHFAAKNYKDKTGKSPTGL